MTPVDEAAREAARRDLETSLLVEAGAGTGKTSLIVERIANLVDAGVALDDVVAITFTEKAAGELRLRVRGELERRSSDPERAESMRDRARSALSVLDRAAITTIHAWCARVLREYPVEAGVDPLFNVLDAGARQELFDRTWERWLGRELSREGAAPFDIALFTADEWVRELEGIARMLVEHRAELPAALPKEIGGDPLSAALAALDSLDIDALTSACLDPDDGLATTFASIAGFRDRFRSATAALRRELLLRQEHLGRAGYGNWGNRANWGGKKSEALPRAREALTAAQEEWIRARTALTNDVCARVAAWLAAGFLPEYEEEKRAAGALDFDDLLLRTRDLIRDHAHVRSRLRRRLRLIVDEFQDTDPVQCETAFLLASPSRTTRWEDARPAPGALFLVGDPKQSIYAFRGADVETYSAARDVLASDGHLQEISTNFRSRAPVLEWVNAVFDKLLVASPDPQASRFQIGYRPLQAHFGAGGTGGGVHVIRPPAGAEFPTVFHSRDAEARAVAGLLRDHAIGRWVVRDRLGGDRLARRGDVVVLLRNRKSSLPAFERAFRAASIPFVVVGGRALWARAEVRALTALCLAVENPFDGVSVVAALKSPFFGASDADLLLWRHRRGSLAAHRAVEDDGSVVGGALARLARWHEARTEMPPARLLEQILAETGAVASFGLKPDGPQRVANLLRLLDAARSSDVAENGVRQSFRAWVGWLAERARDIREEAEGAVLEDDADAVRILTMHAAKGLEFPIVVLGDLAMRDSRGDHRIFDRDKHSLQFRVSARDIRLETAGLQEAREGFDARQEAEDRRLLYVAATRARDALVVPMFASDNKASFHRTLVETFPALLAAPAGSLVAAGDGGPAFVHVVGENLQPIEGEPPVLRLPVAELEAALALAPVTNPGEDPDARALRLGIGERTRARQIRSVTSILPTDAAPRVFAGVSTGLTREEAAQVGESVHAALEHGDLADPDDLERNARLQAKARLLSSAATERAARLARGAAGLPALIRARTAARTMREWNFVLPVDAGFWSAGAWLLEGVIDLAWVEQGGLVILDYKTDAVGRSDEAVAEAAAHHLPQLLAYAWAASRTTGLKVHSTVVALLEAERAVERRVTEEDLLRARGLIETAFSNPPLFNQPDLRR